VSIGKGAADCSIVFCQCCVEGWCCVLWTVLCYLYVWARARGEGIVVTRVVVLFTSNGLGIVSEKPLEFHPPE
jgi:hypothetical protein